MKDYINKIHLGHCAVVLDRLPKSCVNTIVTSPPYWGLRDYGGQDELWEDGWIGQLGLEPTPEQYIDHLCSVFEKCKRVLKANGTLWINIGDTYFDGKGKSGSASPETQTKRKRINKGETQLGGAGYTRPQDFPHPEIKQKDLVGIPWMMAFALRKSGWYLRSEIIWHKPNPMPESTKDRPTRSHEKIFMFSKSKKYFYNYKAIMEPADYDGRNITTTKSEKYKNVVVPNKDGNFHSRERERWVEVNGVYCRNKRNVWTVPTEGFSGAHFAVFPQKLILPCILAGCPEGGVVLDTFCGTNTTGIVARKNNFNYIGIEQNEKLKRLGEKRTFDELGMFQ